MILSFILIFISEDAGKLINPILLIGDFWKTIYLRFRIFVFYFFSKNPQHLILHTSST